MKIELNGGGSSDIAEIRTESVAVLDQHLEMEVPSVKITPGPVRKPQMWNALKNTINKEGQ